MCGKRLRATVETGPVMASRAISRRQLLTHVPTRLSADLNALYGGSRPYG
jgi:hypothetical protein